MAPVLRTVEVLRFPGLVRSCLGLGSTGASSLSVPCQVLPAIDPGDVTAQGSTKIQRCFVDVEFVHRGPEFQSVSMTLALVTEVTAGIEIDRERSAAWRGRAVNGTRAVPLVARSGRRLEVQLV